MHFQSHTVVERSLQTVAAFFADGQNLVKWDRSVAKVEPTSSSTAAVGTTFDTVAPNGLRMSYRITAHDPESHSTIELMPSKMFTRAVWRLQYDRVAVGTRITCDVDFTLRPLYWFLALPLMLSQKKALARDLRCLKEAIEAM